MGTRADFYIRNENSEPKMKWLGSVGMDGYPDGIDKEVLTSITDSEFETQVLCFLKNKRHSTMPEEGWPWPWDDSRTTDYSYVFENGKVLASCFGYPLFDPLKEERENDDTEDKLDGFFPDMTAIKNVQMGEKSGLIIIRGI